MTNLVENSKKQTSAKPVLHIRSALNQTKKTAQFRTATHAGFKPKIMHNFAQKAEKRTQAPGPLPPFPPAERRPWGGGWLRLFNFDVSL